MAKERGLSEMELNLRTVLLQRMAGQSRSMINNAVQTTRLVVGFFLQNGHKTLDEILGESSPEMLAELSPAADTPQLAGLESREQADYEQLRRFITEKVLSSPSLASRGIRTQACIEVLVEGGLTVQQLRQLYQKHGRDEVRFYTDMRNQLEANYKKLGPPDMWFANFVGFVAEFLERGDGEVKAADAPPSWYVCRNCKEAGRHWIRSCTAPRFKSGQDDCLYLSEFIAQSMANHSVVQSLVGLRNHLENEFSKALEHAPTPATTELYSLTAKGVVAGMAALNIPMKQLKACKHMTKAEQNDQLFRRLRYAGAFPALVNLEVIIDIIKDYVTS